MYRAIIIFLWFPFLLNGQEWQWFHSELAGFNVKICGELVKQEQLLQTNIGEVNLHSFIHKPEDEKALNFLYLINFCEYPEVDSLDNENDIVAELLDKSILQSAEDLNGEIIYSSDIIQNGFPGKISRIEYSDHQAVVKSKMILAGRRFYSIQVYSLIEKSLNDEIDIFLNSFQIKILE